MTILKNCANCSLNCAKNIVPCLTNYLHSSHNISTVILPKNTIDIHIYLFTHCFVYRAVVCACVRIKTILLG